MAAKTILVGNCSGAQFATIQEGVDAASPGDTVLICHGTYAEQVTINGAGKAGITLRGRGSTFSAVTISPPSGGLMQNAVPSINGTGLVAANVLVINALGVTITNLTIDDANSGVNPSGGIDVVGVFYQGASGTIQGIKARNQNIGNIGCGIWVDASGETSILSDTITRFGESFAIIVTGKGTTVNMANNTEVGEPDPVFIFGGASAVIGNNSNPAQ